MGKIPTYPALTAPNNNDLLVIEDSVSASTKKITRGNLLSGTQLPANTVNTQSVTDNSITASKLATNAITLGYTQITTNATVVGTTVGQAGGLSVTVTIPAGGRRIKVTAFTDFLYNSNAGALSTMSIWDGTVGSGTQISRAVAYAANNNTGAPATAIAIVTPAAGSKTYNVGLNSSAAQTAGLEASSTYPAFILVEAI